MSDTGWYQRRLAAVRGRPAPQQTPVSEFRGTPAPQPHPGAGFSPQFVPVPQYQQGQAQAQPEKVTVENIYLQAANWRQGPGAKSNPDPCPQCGSNQYFANIPSGRRGPAPAGHCYNCGFNDGMFTQGLASSWGG